MHDESFSPLAMPLDYHGGSKMNPNFCKQCHLLIIKIVLLNGLCLCEVSDF